MVAYGYEMSLLVVNSSSYSFAALTCELSILTLEEKIHIYAHRYVILYFSA